MANVSNTLGTIWENCAWLCSYIHVCLYIMYIQWRGALKLWMLPPPSPTIGAQDCMKTSYVLEMQHFLVIKSKRTELFFRADRAWEFNEANYELNWRVQVLADVTVQVPLLMKLYVAAVVLAIHWTRSLARAEVWLRQATEHAEIGMIKSRINSLFLKLLASFTTIQPSYLLNFRKDLYILRIFDVARDGDRQTVAAHCNVVQ